MENKITSYYDSKTGIFYKNYVGDVFFEDLFNSWEEVIQKKLIPKNVKKFIINYKKAKITFVFEKAVDIANFYKKHDDIFGNSKIAMVMETPDQVVFPHLVELENVTFTVKTFYTLEAAIRWLEI
jgi:hypothetical protein